MRGAVAPEGPMTYDSMLNMLIRVLRGRGLEGLILGQKGVIKGLKPDY